MFTLYMYRVAFRAHWNKSFAHIEDRAGAVGRERLVLQIPIPTPKYLLSSQWVLRIHFRFGLNTCSHYTKMCGTEPIRYVTFHFRDRLPRCRNRAEITVLTREHRRPMRRAFASAQSYPVEGEHSLSQFQALLFPTPTPVADTTKAMAVKTSLDIVTSRCLKLPRDYSTLVHSAE